MIVLLPEILILLGMLNLFFVKNKFSELESKKVFSIAKVYLLFSAISAVTVYNNHIEVSFLHQNPRVMLIKSAIYIYAIIWFLLSSRWFANKGESGIRFAIIAMAQILSSLLLATANNIIIMAVLVSFLLYLNYQMFLLRRHAQEHQENINSYKKSAIVFAIVFWIGAFLFNSHEVAAIVLMLPTVFFLLGIAPFHNGFINIASKAILPVSGMIVCINFLGAVVLINYLTKFVFSQKELIQTILQTFGLISLFVGAIYANKQTNIRRILAYTATFHMGAIILALSSFSKVSDISAFFYLLIYSISMFGAFCTFYGIKQDGEYKKNICRLHGIAHSNPFIINCFLVFIVSLIGSPPIIGFGARISLVNTLVSEGHFVFVFLFMAALMILISAFLNVLKAFYFAEPVNKKYDRVDYGVRLVLCLNIIFAIVTAMSPALFMTYIQEVFNKI